jgi:hypothetical protein
MSALEEMITDFQRKIRYGGARRTIQALALAFDRLGEHDYADRLRLLLAMKGFSDASKTNTRKQEKAKESGK